MPESFDSAQPVNNSKIWVFTKNDLFSLNAGRSDEIVSKLIEQFIIRLNIKSREKQVASIEHNTDSLKSYISKTKQDNKWELTEITKKIDVALQEIKRIDEHDKKLLDVEKDIVGMRHIVGESKDFQEWRALTCDVQRLKDEQVGRKEYDADLKRLDEKIELINDRIEDAREIKFWSKRTILDVALAVFAAVASTIAGLLAAGII